MSSEAGSLAVRFVPARTVGRCDPYLAFAPGTPEERRFPFADQLEIGRDEAGRESVPGVLLIADPTVSRRHCTITRDVAGRYLVRDTSRNGTRLDGRRLVPNIEVELRPGQRLAVSQDWEFVLEGERAAAPAAGPGGVQTVGVASTSVATVLVGDIRDYTTLVRRAPSAELQQSVGRVFEVLTAAVAEHGGTVKEYQGDAILAFWEGNLRGTQAVSACRAAIRLHTLAQELAGDRSIWQLSDFPLQMDWALATGLVRIDSFGGDQRAGLSMVGEPIVLASRLEKFAGAQTGPILVCRATRDMAGRAFRFRDLGDMTAKGFERPGRVFALESEVPGDGETLAARADE